MFLGGGGGKSNCIVFLCFDCDEIGGMWQGAAQCTMAGSWRGDDAMDTCARG